MTAVDDRDPILKRIVTWAAGRDDVRAALLTSTRAVSGGKVDSLSDYDIILVVRNVRPYADDHAWIEDFGPVLVAYWDPVEPDMHQASNVVQYEGALKIDFGVWSVEKLRQIVAMPGLPDEFDAGYRVIVDKDGLANDLAPPTYRGYVTILPDRQTFLTLVNDFFIGVPYVTKCLLRDEILPAKWCLDYDMRYVYLLPMLEWLAASSHGGEAKVGVNGKGLKRLLPPGWWDDLETTWAGGDVEANWSSLFAMAELFGRAGREVASACGFTYPEYFHQRVVDHAHAMRAGAFGRP